jgi:tRNA modification GTPase
MEWLSQDKDTIAAIATPSGEGGVGIVRLSGPQALSILTQCFRPFASSHQWQGHQMVYGTIVDTAEQMLDEVLSVWMPKGRSYTGEEVVEIHGHGGQLNMIQLLRRVLSSGARLAEPGEFTRRAFLTGRIDLTKAEAIVDLITAKNEQALRIARDHLQGRLRDRLVALADRSLMLAAQVESWIDFPEEFDPALDASVARVLEDVRLFSEEVASLLASYQQGRQLQEGWSVLLLGRPNAGKSSLFNLLYGEQRAIVTNVPGTTRDLLDTQLALGGIQLTLTDSAGLRESQDSSDPHSAIEQVGVQMAKQAAERAHLILVVFDLSRPFSDEDRTVLEASTDTPTIWVLNKSDLPRAFSLEEAQAITEPVSIVEVSCETEAGLPELLSDMTAYMESQTPGGELLITNERQREALEQASQHLRDAMTRGVELGPEFMAEDLRCASKVLASITGNISSEDVLSAIFSRFCIGK